MNILVATDLHGTVAFSERNNGAATGLVSADESGKVLHAATTPLAYQTLARLARTGGAVVPVATRSTGAYQRLRLPRSPPRFAFVCNDARLLVDSVPDELHSLGLRPAHCHITSTSGASTGEEILHWYALQLAESIRTTRR